MKSPSLGRLSIRGSKPTPKPDTKKQTTIKSRKPPKPEGYTGKSSSAPGVVRRGSTVDPRGKRLKDALFRMEKALGIRGDSANGLAVNPNQNIEDFVRSYQEYLNKIPKIQRTNMKYEVRNALTTLQIVNNYMRYYREVRIAFAGFDAIKDICFILTQFKYDIDDGDFTTVSSSQKESRKKIRRQQVRYLNNIWAILAIADGKSSKVKITSFAYRFLRLFGLCVMIREYVTASVLADILLEQITYEQQLRRRHNNDL